MSDETETESSTASSAGPTPARSRLVALHGRWGWGGLLGFTLLGVVLEGLHAFKAGSYLDVGNEARRLCLRLAHAHGALLSLVNLAFAGTVERAGHRPPARARPSRARLASRGLRTATVLIPAGFLLGALGAEAGDPGVAIALVPAGAVALVIALLLILLEVG